MTITSIINSENNEFKIKRKLVEDFHFVENETLENKIYFLAFRNSSLYGSYRVDGKDVEIEDTHFYHLLSKENQYVADILNYVTYNADIYNNKDKDYFSRNSELNLELQNLFNNYLKSELLKYMPEDLFVNQMDFELFGKNIFFDFINREDEEIFNFLKDHLDSLNIAPTILEDVSTNIKDIKANIKDFNSFIRHYHYNLSDLSNRVLSNLLIEGTQVDNGEVVMETNGNNFYLQIHLPFRQNDIAPEELNRNEILIQAGFNDSENSFDFSDKMKQLSFRVLQDFLIYSGNKIDPTLIFSNVNLIEKFNFYEWEYLNINIKNKEGNYHYKNIGRGFNLSFEQQDLALQSFLPNVINMKSFYNNIIDFIEEYTISEDERLTFLGYHMMSEDIDSLKKEWKELPEYCQNHFIEILQNEILDENNILNVLFFEYIDVKVFDKIEKIKNGESLSQSIDKDLENNFSKNKFNLDIKILF